MTTFFPLYLAKIIFLQKIDLQFVANGFGIHEKYFTAAVSVFDKKVNKEFFFHHSEAKPTKTR